MIRARIAITECILLVFICTSPLVMMMFFGRLIRRFSFQKLFFLPFLFEVVRALRIHLLHLFDLARRESRKMADEVNQLPRVLCILFCAAAPGGHSAQTNTVLDDVEQLTIAHPL